MYGAKYGLVGSLNDLLGTSLDVLSPSVLLASIGNIVTWEFVGYNVLIFYSSLSTIPHSLYEAASIDGVSEWQIVKSIKIPELKGSLAITVIFSNIGSFQLFNEPNILQNMVPGIVTTSLFTIVATWNNYFLPLIMLKDADWYPLTIGLNQWKDQANTAGGTAIQNLVITGSLITIIPLVIAFLLLQKYWQSGLAAGAVKE